MEKEAKVIFSPQLANFLLKKGFPIIKLKQKRDNPDQSVYVFAVGPGFSDAILEWTKNVEE